MQAVRFAGLVGVCSAVAVMMGGCPTQAPDGAVAGALFENGLTGKIGPVGSDGVAPPAPVEAVSGPVPGGPTSEVDPEQAPLPVEQPGPFEPGDVEDLAPEPRPPFGTWLLESGGALTGFITGLATFSETADVTALTLNDDGTGRVFFRDRLTGAKDCVRVFALFDGDELVIDFSAEPASDFVFNLAIGDATTFFFPVVVADDETLGIAGVDGQIALFSRRQQLPDSVTCGTLEVLDTFEVPDPQFFGDLVEFNGDLVYNSGAGQFEAFDLATDTLAAPLAVTSSRLVQTVQGGFFWTHCGCGGSRDAFKRTLSSVFDTVSSEDEMGGPITFRAMAYNAQTDRLWLHGRSFDSQFGVLYVMNTNGEPDTVEQTLSFNRDLRALTFEGNELWGVATIATQVVVRIDPETGKVSESYELPDEDVSWNGLEIVGDEMYLLGRTLDNRGVLYRVARP